MKSLARRYCYWRHIDKDIEGIANSCQICAGLKKDPPACPMHFWDTPKSCWDRVHMDYAGPFLGHQFFIVIDSLSKWPEVMITKSLPTSESTISMLETIFIRFGLPHILVSDNASIFKSETFQAFCKMNGIQHRTIAQGHPATNGQAERFVQTLKNRLKALEQEPIPSQEPMH